MIWLFDQMTKPNSASLEIRARTLKALAHPSRLLAIEELAEGERCVCELVDLIGSDFSTVSKHLAVLRNAGLVATSKRGSQVFYRLRCPCIVDFLACVERATAEALA